MAIQRRYTLLSEATPDAVAALAGLRSNPIELFHGDYGAKHPTALYAGSLSHVATRFQAVFERLDAANAGFAQSLGSHPPDYPWSDPLILATRDLVYALFEHIDDCKGVLRSFFPKSDMTFARRAIDQYERATPYRQQIGLMCNAMKHHQRNLRLAVSWTRVEAVLGYFVEGPHPNDTLGPDSKFHDGRPTAFSFNRDLRFHLCGIFEAGAALANGLQARGVLPAKARDPWADASWSAIVQKIGALPLRCFSSEIGFPEPEVRVGSAVIVAFPTERKRMSALSGIVGNQMIMKGDGHTQKYAFPNRL